MLEREVIQSVGFRNTTEDGKVTGFQFRVRIPYYRGIFLCQLRPGSVTVDGKKIEKEDSFNKFQKSLANEIVVATIATTGKISIIMLNVLTVLPNNVKVKT